MYNKMIIGIFCIFFLTSCRVNKFEIITPNIFGSPKLSENELNECLTLQQRLLQPHNKKIIDAEYWTLTHCAEPSDLKLIGATMKHFSAAYDKKSFGYFISNGGSAKLKQSFINLLKNNDPVIRGFASMALAVIGDPVAIEPISDLIDKNKSVISGDEDYFVGVDVKKASIALGLLKAHGKTNQILSLTNNPDEGIRSGACLALGYMGEKKYSSRVSELLSDREEEVVKAALHSLGLLEAKEYSKDVEKLLHKKHCYLKKEIIYTLAKLNSKSSKSEIAKLLKGDCRGDAAKALAILGGKEYSSEIIKLITDGDSRVIGAALIAIGILQDKRFIKELTWYLNDNSTHVSSYAATALLMMNAKDYSGDIYSNIHTKRMELDTPLNQLEFHQYFANLFDLPPVLWQPRDLFISTIKKNWNDMYKSNERF